VVEVSGLARPALVSGPLAGLPDGEPTRAWAVTPRVRRGAPFARVAHRGFALDLARELGVALEGARLVRSVVELRDHLAGGGADLAPDGRWVLKAPWSAAGRWRLLGDADDGRIGRFLARFGEGLFEPWLPRVADRGVSAEVLESGEVVLRGAHEQTIDATGRCVGIRPVSRIEPAEAEVAAAAGRALAREGHVGPFGIDGWRGLDRGGRERANLLGEINPRLTMGRVAHEILGRIGGERLRMDAGLPDRSDLTPLLLPGSEDPVCAWIDRRGPASPEEKRTAPGAGS
jgi:hypothetical protein